ncbi:MAG: ArsR/SmtB family transcription factor [Alphaproteobacteria bacterium]
MDDRAAPLDPAAFAAKAAAVAGTLKALANPRRLAILCRLAESGEATVGSLAVAVGLSQSALSQHLARMRQEGIVAFRRDAQTLWYRIDDPRIAALMAELYRLYCGDAAPPQKQKED